MITNTSDLPEWFSLIQSNRAYYTDVYHKMSHRPMKWSWNWSAFLVPGWCLYRKCFIIFAALGLVQYFLESYCHIATIETLAELKKFNFLVLIDSPLKIFFLIIELLILPLFNNYFYFLHLKYMYKRGYRPQSYSDVNPFARYVIALGFLLIPLLYPIYIAMKDLQNKKRFLILI
jgi:hypothetical protein